MRFILLDYRREVEQDLRLELKGPARNYKPPVRPIGSQSVVVEIQDTGAQKAI